MPFSFLKGKSRKIRRAVGLDIGSHSVKMVVLSGAPGALTLVDCVVSSADPPSENPLPADVLAQKILDIVERNELDVSDLRVSVSGRGAIVRHVEMPRMSPQELKTGIRYEAEILLPFSLDDCIFDCQILDADDNKDSAKMKVVLAAARKAVVQDRLELLKGIGLVPRIISIDSIALANAFEHAMTGPAGAAVKPPASDLPRADFSGEQDLQYGDDDLDAHDRVEDVAPGMTGAGSHETSLVVHVGASRTIVNVMSAAGLEFTRDVEVGGNNATLAIARGLGIDFQEAEHRKHEGDAATREFVASKVMILSRELRSTCSYVTSKMNTNVGKIFLSGGGSLCRGVRETLSAETGIEVLFWNPLSGIPAAEGMTPEETSGREAILAVATGLALED